MLSLFEDQIIKYFNLYGCLVSFSFGDGDVEIGRFHKPEVFRVPTWALHTKFEIANYSRDQLGHFED